MAVIVLVGKITLSTEINDRRHLYLVYIYLRSYYRCIATTLKHTKKSFYDVIANVLFKKKVLLSTECFNLT